MPWHYRFDPRCDAFLSDAFDLLTGEEITLGVAEILRDPNFRPDVRIFDDFTRVSRYIFPDRIESALHLQQEARRLRGRHAILLGSTLPSGPGADLFLEATGRPAARFRVFFERDDALAWLNEGVAKGEWILAPEAPKIR